MLPTSVGLHFPTMCVTYVPTFVDIVPSQRLCLPPSNVQGLNLWVLMLQNF